MTRLAVQSAPGRLPPELSVRLRTLGLTVLWITHDGRARFGYQPDALEQMVVSGGPFTAAVRSLWPELRQTRGRAMQVWPGVFLIPLAGQPQRRTAADQDQALPAVLVLSEALIDSEQLRLVCSVNQIDLAATVQRIDGATLVKQPQIDRLAVMLKWMIEDTSKVHRRAGELQTMTEELGEAYEELSLLYKFSVSMTLGHPPAQFLSDACAELQQVAGLRWMALQLVDDDPRLNDLAGSIFTAGPAPADEKLLKELGQRLTRREHDAGAPQVIDDLTTLDLPGAGELASELLVVPLMGNDQPTGILFGGDKQDGQRLSSIDAKLCSSLGSSLAMFIENMMLYEDSQAMFLGTLHALTASIDAKDSYTHGHSERVALMSRALATAVGLDPHTVERAYLSGLVHDVGKIGVADFVLTKPDKLTVDEFEQIKKHPEIGARILQGIRQMQDLIPGVLCHHERWDGRGYPAGLAAEEIPLFGRLICLADSFDAMSSKRSYRGSLALDEALAEIHRCSGSQFDPAMVEAFVQLDFGPFFHMLGQHQPDVVPPEAA